MRLDESLPVGVAGWRRSTCGLRSAARPLGMAADGHGQQAFVNDRRKLYVQLSLCNALTECTALTTNDQVCRTFFHIFPVHAVSQCPETFPSLPFPSLPSSPFLPPFPFSSLPCSPPFLPLPSLRSRNPYIQLWGPGGAL